VSPIRIALPSSGRLRDGVRHALEVVGYGVGRPGSQDPSRGEGDIDFIEMRTRDAAEWLSAGRLAGAFISTDTALEASVDTWPTVELGFARSDLVVACPELSSAHTLADLSGATVATHLPRWTSRWFGSVGVGVHVVPMAGSLEGVCASGMADALVDLRQTGDSLRRHRLRVVEVGPACQAVFVAAPTPDREVDDLMIRLRAAVEGEHTQYVMFHLHRDRVSELASVWPGLESPTVIPVARRDDIVAVHLAVAKASMWKLLAELRTLGATGIVVLPVDAVM
jgi:ATP phosphoribosyltransferase